MADAPTHLAPEYLTGVLRRSGVLDRGEVTQVKSTLTKKLYVSVVSRLEISYSANAPASAPHKLFLKASIPDHSHELSSAYSAEVEFYNVIAGEMHDPPFIRCYEAAFSEAGEHFILMEDLTDTHSQPESPTPPTKEQSKQAVECLARLHAFWWEHPQIGKTIGSLFDEQKLNDFTDRTEKNVIGFLDHLGDSLSDKRRKIYHQMLASMPGIWGRLTDAKGLTVTSGDAHWWNFLYPIDSALDSVRMFDWQLWHIDLGARDLAFLIALGGFAEPRPALEPDLTRHYHDSLLSHGVPNYTWDDLWTDYRLSAIRNLNIPVIQWSQGKETELWSSNLERAMRSFKDLKCAELL